MAEAAEDMRMDEIERLTRAYAGEHTELGCLVGALEDELEALKREHLPRIREAVRATQGAREALQAQVEATPDLWQPPRRTVVIEGVRVGYQKGKGRLVWERDDAVVRLIRKHFPDQAEVLVQTKETPVRKALQQLTAVELQKLGVSIEGADDEVVIRPTDSDVDKLVAKLLEAAERESGEVPSA